MSISGGSRAATISRSLPAMTPIYRDREPADLRAAPRRRRRSTRIIVVQAAETLAETLFTIGLSARFPWIAGDRRLGRPAIAVASRRRSPRSRSPAGCKGIRPVAPTTTARSPGCSTRASSAAGALMRESGLVLEFLVQNPDEVPLVTHFAARHPDMPIVLDHCAKPDIARRAVRALGGRHRRAGAHCRTSPASSPGLLNCAPPGAGAAELRPYADHVLGAFGPDRLIWASDWPPLDLAAGLCDLAARQPRAARRPARRRSATPSSAAMPSASTGSNR